MASFLTENAHSIDEYQYVKFGKGEEKKKKKSLNGYFFLSIILICRFEMCLKYVFILMKRIIIAWFNTFVRIKVYDVNIYTIYNIK